MMIIVVIPEEVKDNEEEDEGCTQTRISSIYPWRRLQRVRIGRDSGKLSYAFVFLYGNVK